MTFSERFGHKQPKLKIQLESMDIDLRNGLWNVIKLSIFEDYQINNSIDYQEMAKRVLKSSWVNFFKLPVDDMSYNIWVNIGELKKVFLSWNWWKVYDFIEFFLSIDYRNFKRFENEFNTILERELSGYRIIDGFVTPITENYEIETIEEAIENAKDNKLNGVKEHLEKGIEFLSDKKKPNYRNSIKESISAVESITKIIADDSNADLSKAIKIIDDKIELNPALKSGFNKLYGYTSSEKGVRHALLNESSKVDFEDAKFMLVSCSAFINYLIEKCRKAKIKLN